MTAPANGATGSQLNRSALGTLGLKGLPLKPDLLKTSKSAAVLDDSVETKRKLQTLDLPEVDMTMVDGQANIGDLEADDDEDAGATQAKAADAMDEDDDDIDPLEAFMSGVKEEVKKVNLEDMKKMKASGNLGVRLDERDGDDGDEEGPELDELDATNLNPEDILALAAKKAKKKDLAAVDHSRIAYEPFRKEFYIAPPDIAEMTDDEADLLRLELDGIKIRGVDCPRPVTKWSHFGLPASWYVVIYQTQRACQFISGRESLGEGERVDSVSCIFDARCCTLFLLFASSLAFSTPLATAWGGCVRSRSVTGSPS